MNLIKSTSTFSFFTLISRILGYLRDVLIAIHLGAGPIADAFFVAFRIPNTFRRLFSEGTFNAAFVPSYSSELTKSTNINNIFKTIGAAAATANLLCEFNIAEKNDDKLTNNRNGNVILVREIVKSSFG